MQLKVLTYFLIMAFSLTVNLNGQSSCSGINASMLCSIAASDINEFQHTTFSKNVLLQTRVAYKYSVVLVPGKDYIIGVCCETAYKPVKFKIIDLQKDTIFYDNSQDDYKQFIRFVVEGNPMNIIIEVTVLSTDKIAKPGEELRSCMGLKVLCRTIGKKGFY